MSQFPVRKELHEKEIRFCKIKTKKLSRIYIQIAGAISKASIAPELGEQSETAALLEVFGDEKLEKIQDEFFANIEIEGVGIAKDALEKDHEFFDEDINRVFELFAMAIQVYLGKQLNGATAKATEEKAVDTSLQKQTT